MEKGSLGMQSLGAVHHVLDPHSIMNPGKLFVG